MNALQEDLKTSLVDTNIDISKVPFSKYGSNIAVCRNGNEGKLTMHNPRRLFGEDHILDLEFEHDGSAVDFLTSAVPDSITVETTDGSAKLYLQGDNTLVIESENLDLHLKLVHGQVRWGYQKEEYPTAYGVQSDDRRFKMVRVDSRLQIYIEVTEGVGVLQGPMERNPRGEERDCKCWLRIKPENGRCVIIIRTTIDDFHFNGMEIDPQKGKQLVREQWKRWKATMPEVPSSHNDIAETTWYNIWSSFVRAEGTYKYDAMLMSKNFMCSVWSWDHCFNALCIAMVDLDKGIEQFLLPFEVQSESGALPDFFNPYSEIVWGVTKPPIHGWAFSLLMEKYTIDHKTLRKVYGHLERWTNWWMDYRDSDHDGIPEFQQGCDGGGDNYTVYDAGFFIESPDLSAYLVLQMRALSQIAGKLNNGEQEQYWLQRSIVLLEKLYAHSWIGNRFVAMHTGSHEIIENTTCLSLLLPIVLGDLLDSEKMDTLVTILEDEFLTENGPATEALKSKFYEPDSYWRGPIWAPTTYLLVDGLRRGEHIELATKIARGFCEMIRDRAGGNYENFDAITGKGLRAPGYTWTASVHMLLLNEYLLE